MATVRWTGLGILVLPIIILSVIGGAFVTTSLLYDLAAQGGDGIDHGGVPLGGIAAGLVLGGLVTQGLGALLNRRRLPDGRVVWTGRHQFGYHTVEEVGRGLVVIGAPLAAVGFVPAAVVWVLLVAWAAVVVAALVVRSRRRERREVSEVRYLR
jgi:hypothetical protein